MSQIGLPHGEEGETTLIHWEAVLVGELMDAGIILPGMNLGSSTYYLCDLVDIT